MTLNQKEKSALPMKPVGATWIWGGKDPRPLSAFRLFRREFDVDSLPKSVTLRCFAESRYKLYINGEFIQTGPTFCQPSHRLLDRHEIASFLKPGRNCVAFMAYCPGTMIGQWTLCNPGFLCEIHSKNNRVKVETDSSWRTLAGDAWHAPTEMCGYAKGFMEWHDLRKMPAGWTEQGFDDSGWEAAKELPFFAEGESSGFDENDIGYPTLNVHPPVRLLSVSIGSGTVTEKMREIAKNSYAECRQRWFRMMGVWPASIKFPIEEERVPEPIAFRADMEEQSPAPEGTARSVGESILPMEIRVPESGGHPVLTLDFGVVRSGFWTIEVESESGGTIDMGGDDRIGDDGRALCCRSTPNCERVDVPPGRVSWEGFFERGVRYAQVIFRDFHGIIRLNRVGIRETLSAVPTATSAEFVCSDELLNRIWKAAAETTRLYMTNGCAPGDPVRERAPWMGDDTIAMRMAFYCFGDWKIWKRALELIAESQNTDGSFPVVSPGHFEDFNIVLGPCGWVAHLAEYMDCTGDREFGEAILSHVRRHINYELRFADGNGLLYETPGRRFLSWADATPHPPYAPGETWKKTGRTQWGDWLNPPTRGFNAIINIHWLWCLREASRLARELGHTEESERWRIIFNTAKPAFETMFWVPETGLYRDNVPFDPDGNSPPPTFCESTLFYLMRCGLIDREWGMKCLRRMWKPDFICCRSSGGLEFGAVPPFLIEAGYTAEALDLWKDRWGMPVLAGATTSGEEFFHCGGNSDCHIHGATPARDFIEYLAGIRLAGPMWSKVVFAPPDKGPDLRCEVPTTRGPIRVEIKTLPDKTRQFRYSVPPGTEAMFRKKDGTMAPLREVNDEIVLT